MIAIQHFIKQGLAVPNGISNRKMYGSVWGRSNRTKASVRFRPKADISSRRVR